MVFCGFFLSDARLGAESSRMGLLRAMASGAGVSAP